jgi:2-dehydro-3-deoxyphosphogluconate aldolase/(4S)-4-hydroxy-2-oxoglutarate aldolase
MEPGANVSEVIDGIIGGGISIIEVTLTTPNALAIIQDLAGESNLVVGAGTVLDAASAHAAIEAGARFYASPILDEGVIRIAHGAGCLAMPGACTPTEIYRAWRAGADLIKIFPMPAEGARFIRSVRGPLPYIPLAPSGGVTAATAAAMLAAGASALNVGTWLTHEEDGKPGMEGAIRERAERVRRAIGR